ncbi:Hypothetical predicted protein [Cloeon dipterum]|uniref:Uncharacterized protein n=1 Tax=Cloeon dipterum TaxID=197152 RepID=A0A8S1D6T4_9INSE|nr:Hypothetical predicted protein [Cloeon dipterum]
MAHVSSDKEQSAANISAISSSEKDSQKYARQQLQHILGICKSKLQTLRQSQSFSRQYKAVHRVWRARGCLRNASLSELTISQTGCCGPDKEDVCSS